MAGLAQEISRAKWVRPEAQQAAVRRAKERADASRWSLDVAIFLFAILAIVLILSFEHIDIIITAVVAVSGLGMVWVVGWRQGKQSYGLFLEEELSRCAEDWKDYYQILRVSPRADTKTIAEAYQRLTRIFYKALSEEAQRLPMYTRMLDEAGEAYRVISNPVSREAYDGLYWVEANRVNVVIEEPVKNEVLDLSQSITGLVEKHKTGTHWRMPHLSLAARRALSIGAIALLVFIFSGTTLAFAKPGYPLAAPFKGVAVTLAKTTGGAIGLLEDIRGAIASYERGVVSTAVQSMRVMDGLKDVQPVTTSTNDMSRFPSPEHPLFPDFLDRQFSQFKYTVNSKGIVDVDTSGATTDALLEKLRQVIERLEAEE